MRDWPVRGAFRGVATFDSPGDEKTWVEYLGRDNFAIHEGDEGDLWGACGVDTAAVDAFADAVG